MPTHLNELPAEVLSQIFVSCLGTGPGRKNKPSDSVAPLNLTLVSKTWSKIANDAPHLWTSIDLNNVPKKDESQLSPETFLDHLGRWMKKFGNVPISIRLLYKHFPEYSTYEEYCKEMKDIVDLLLTCQHRWHTLEIAVQDFSVVQGLLDAMANLDNAPRLREFKLHVDDKKNDKYPASKAGHYPHSASQR
ncbi:hypothetical protein DFH11DRAFT_1785668 [Phellopilus nigrolimitatus]|nr:hypothetical protein DFH11DRAFT_1785668 [Phellopilus nigrolimitatus]